MFTKSERIIFKPAKNSKLENSKCTNNVPDKNTLTCFILKLCKIQDKFFDKLIPKNRASLHRFLAKANQHGLISNIICRC